MLHAGAGREDPCNDSVDDTGGGAMAALAIQTRHRQVVPSPRPTPEAKQNMSALWPGRTRSSQDGGPTIRNACEHPLCPHPLAIHAVGRIQPTGLFYSRSGPLTRWGVASRLLAFIIAATR